MTMNDTCSLANSLAEPSDVLAPPAPEPVLSTQLAIGEPTPFALIDLHGRSLLPAGTILPDEAARDFLFDHFAMYRYAARPVEVAAQLQPQTARADADSSELALEDINLKIGARLRIRPPQQTGFGVVLSHVIGFAPNGALFVTRPYTAHHDVRLLFGERLEILYVERRSVFDFVCTVDAVCKIPFDFLVLSEPSNIRRLRVRNATRINLVLPVLYRSGPSDQPLSPGACTGVGMMTDLSPVGLSMLAPQLLAEPGERMRVAFDVQSDGGTLHIDVAAIVRNVREQRRPAMGNVAEIVHGLEFEHLDAQTRLSLRCLVLEQVAA
jgi:hypothetical protein